MHRLTSAQSKYRAYLLNLTPLQYTHHPVGFNTWKDGLHGNVEAFMEYFNSGHCAKDHDAIIAAYEHQFDEHFNANFAQYRNQIPIIPGRQAMQEHYVPEEEPSTTEELCVGEQQQADDPWAEEISPEYLP